ncbi:alpha/beta fold hydrolase [Candidatus Odyssella thessalonicensis]|uniref:alpha/beta fold hydrolase n=1 Tax=Candidatus Odyssella thessalonicensis TaxID=84647 RepID=UPI000225B76A|nr:alpha/beta hydrolase [Candidatus Odyssella thessalonicensis]
MKYFYDGNQIRYTLVSTNGNSALNWLFIPGGAGADSSYYKSLTDHLHCSGNTWLIDFPGNGDHKIPLDNYDQWLSLFIPMVQSFTNPVVVGHSFGAMLPLLFKECESLLKGMVILNSAPCLWLEEAARFAQEHKLPDLTAEMKEFINHPCQETFNKALAACMPYYFCPHHLEAGTQWLKSIPFPYKPAVWWLRKAHEISYTAQWIPKKVKTLIVGAELDAITPFSLYEKDARFMRSNIEKAFIQGAGHYPWLEKPQEVREAFKKFEQSLMPS